MLVQALIAQPPVEGLDVGFLVGLARLDEAQRHPVLVRPDRHRAPAELPPVIRTNHLGQPPLGLYLVRTSPVGRRTVLNFGNPEPCYGERFRFVAATLYRRNSVETLEHKLDFLVSEVGEYRNSSLTLSPVSVVVAEEAQTPSADTVPELIGREEVLARMERGLASFPA